MPWDETKVELDTRLSVGFFARSPCVCAGKQQASPGWLFDLEVVCTLHRCRKWNGWKLPWRLEACPSGRTAAINAAADCRVEYKATAAAISGMTQHLNTRITPDCGPVRVT